MVAFGCCFHLIRHFCSVWNLLSSPFLRTVLSPDDGPLTSDLQLFHHHLHQPPLTMMMMMPGLTEEECQRYQELLEIKCHYERQSEVLQRDAAVNIPVPLQGEEAEVDRREEEEGAPCSSVVADTNCSASLSEHEMALIEEELRHLEFKCRNILRAQKMQQLRERCLKAWMMEEETAGAG